MINQFVYFIVDAITIDNGSCTTHNTSTKFTICQNVSSKSMISKIKYVWVNTL